MYDIGHMTREECNQLLSLLLEEMHGADVFDAIAQWADGDEGLIEELIIILEDSQN